MRKVPEQGQTCLMKTIQEKYSVKKSLMNTRTLKNKVKEAVILAVISITGNSYLYIQTTVELIRITDAKSLFLYLS